MLRDGVTVVTMAEGAELQREHADENMAAMLELRGDPKLRVVSDIRGLRSADKGARDAGASDEFASEVACMALVVGGSVTRMIGTFFLRISRPKYPTRLFTDADEAERWARSFSG